MKSKLDVVKDKIIRFIQEQLRYKSKFNFVTFDGQAIAWREKLAEINEDNLEQAQSWVRDIKAGSSTNTLNALKIAFADKETEVIYLLTDGRPDQPPEMVMDHVKLFQNIPICAISFNYNDEVANEFLKDLAELTGGEFRAYGFGCKDPILQNIQGLQQGDRMFPELFQCHGTTDELVLHSWGEETNSKLKSLGVRTTFHSLPNVYHELNKTELQRLKSWILTKLPEEIDRQRE